MDPKKRIQIITFLLTWILTYESAAVSDPPFHALTTTPNPVPRSIVSSDPCSMVQQFAKDEAAFSTCAITSGNNMCKKCVTHITQLTNSYTKLMSDDSRNRFSGSECLQAMISDSGRERFSSYYGHSRSMWYTNNCDNCYVDSSSQLSRDVQKFFDGAYEFDICVVAHPNDTCDSCKDKYSVLNTWYERLEDDYRGNVCLDVTAVMVNFRGKWFALGCISPLAYDMVVIVIGCTVISACLLMYLISRKFAHMDQPELLIQKRLATFESRQPINSADERTHLLSGTIIP